MKNKMTLAALALALITINSQLSTARAQGSLTPPGAPAPTMITLTQIEPRTPISSLPYTITNPGSYYVTANLMGISANIGIFIGCGNVTLDLNGFTLQGVPGSGHGIYVGSSYTNLVVRNGTLTGWGGSGLNAYSGGYPRNMLFENLTCSANGSYGLYSEAGCIVRDCLAYGNTNDGFNVVGGEITHCVSRNNSGYGFSASVVETGSGCTLRQCLAEYNASGGFTLTNSQALDCNSQYNTGIGFTLGSSRALDCDSEYNSSHGFDCNGTGDEIHRCRISNNGGNGIGCEPSTGGTVIEDCEIANNHGFGIYSLASGSGGGYIARNNLSLNSSNGIVLYNSNNYVEGNHILTTFGIFGIFIAGTNNVVARNVAAGGGLNYFYSGNNDFGPLGSASSATSPWANISH